MHGDAQFGPKSMGKTTGDEQFETDEDTAMEMGEDTAMGRNEDAEMADEESASGSRIPKKVMAVVAFVVLSFAVRKVRSLRSASDAESIEVETEGATASA